MPPELCGTVKVLFPPLSAKLRTKPLISGAFFLGSYVAPYLAPYFVNPLIAGLAAARPARLDGTPGSQQDGSTWRCEGARKQFQVTSLRASLSAPLPRHHL